MKIINKLSHQIPLSSNLWMFGLVGWWMVGALVHTVHTYYSESVSTLTNELSRRPRCTDPYRAHFRSSARELIFAAGGVAVWTALVPISTEVKLMVGGPETRKQLSN